jgi:menaquinone-dependent protoporphyrinogen oxidase
VFAGSLARKQLNFPERAIVSALRVPEGDIRDWTEIRQWTAGIADAMGSRLRPRPDRSGDYMSDRLGRGPDGL